MYYNVFYLLGAGASINNFKFDKLSEVERKTKIGLPLAHNFRNALSKTS
jgi:hypothetical protein